MAAKAPWTLLALGDWRRSEVDRVQIAESFVCSAPCCLRPGLARKLRNLRRRPTELKEMLLSPLWKTIFLQLARVLRLSIAHIEWRHAWNRRHSSACNAWVNFVSAYVNREGQFLLQARRQRQAAQAAASALPPPAPLLALPAPGPAVAEPADGAELLVKKAQSPKEVFRKHWLNIQRQMGLSSAWHPGRWPEVHTAWDALSDQDRQYFTEQAELTRTIAKRNRLRAAAASAAEQQPQSQAALGDLNGASGPMLPVVQPVSYNDWLVALDDDADQQQQPGERGANSLIAAARGYRQQQESRYRSDAPLSVQRYHRYISGLPRGTRSHNLRGGLSGAAARFRSAADAHARPPTAADAFPERVAYDVECGSLCRVQASWRALRVHALLMDAFTRMAGAVDRKVAHIGRHQALFVFEVLNQVDVGGELEEVPQQMFAILSSAQGRSGRFSEKQMFTLCEVIKSVDGGGGELDGTELRIARSGFTPHSSPLPHPYSQSCLGPLCQYTEDEFATRLIKLGQEDVELEDLGAPVVTAERLKYEARGGDELIVISRVHDFPVQIVSLDELDGAAVVGAGAEAVGAEVAGAKAADDDFADIFDVEPELGPGVVPGFVPQVDADAVRADLAALLHVDVCDVEGMEGELADILAVRAFEQEVLASDEMEAAAGEQAEAAAADVVVEPPPPMPPPMPPPGPPPVPLSPEEFATRIGLERCPGWSYRRVGAPTKLGYVRMLPSGYSLKAVCGHTGHVKCSRFLNVEVSTNDTIKDLLAWLSHGPQEASAAAHMAADVTHASALAAVDV